jgi:hypothetical protein
MHPCAFPASCRLYSLSISIDKSFAIILGIFINIPPFPPAQLSMPVPFDLPPFLMDQHLEPLPSNVNNFSDDPGAVARLLTADEQDSR